jgi:thiol peroxidase
MTALRRRVFWLFVSVVLFAGCGFFKPAKPPVNKGSVEPGSAVSRGGKSFALMGTPITIGKPLPSVKLVDAMTGKDVDLSEEKGRILLLSIVPSIDTKVCEAQTHYLGEEGRRMGDEVERITISRDTPFAQKRFSEEAKLTNIRFLSDYKEGQFGRATGLLIEESRLLARSVILVDRQGVVRYIQVVPELSNLPDMDAAFEKTRALAK